MRCQFSVQRLLSARLESIETTTREPSVEIQRMFLFERSHWTTFDVKQGSRGLERSENGFLLDLEDPLDRSVDRDGGRRRKYGGDSVRKEGRKGETAIGNWSDVAFRWTTPRTGRRASTRRREEFERERPAGMKSTPCISTGESRFSRRFLKVAEPRVTGFQSSRGWNSSGPETRGKGG